MSESYTADGHVRPEELMREQGIKMTQDEVKAVGDVYTDFYKMRGYRSGLIKHFRNHTFEQYLIRSRELFWNSRTTESDDLRKLGLEFSIPFARKEALDALSKLTSLNVKGVFEGDNLDSLSLRMLQGMYKKWSFKSNQKVENFWELLYGKVNGTVCSYIGYNNIELQRRYLTSYDPATGDYKIEKKTEKYWDDVEKIIKPIEDIYVPKIFERNIQKQGRLIDHAQMEEADFHAEYDKYPMAKFVFPGARIAQDSLFFRLLGGTGTTSALKIEVMKRYDWISDTYEITAGGLILNRLGNNDTFDKAPMPFNHKMAPFTWGIMSPLDEKLCYGLSETFQAKDPDKLLNTMYTMGMERELRAIDPVVMSSDIDSPDIIYGQHKVLQVNDVNAYKEFKMSEPSPQYFNMMNSLQQTMAANTSGGSTRAIPSKQPDSARATMEDSQKEQEALSNSVIMYYDILRQQMLLVLKTAFQFYTTQKYEDADKGVVRTMLVANSPLSSGGIGNLKMRIVQKKQSDMTLFLEAIKESIMNGKETEIVEIPVTFIDDLEFNISDIKLEPDNANEIELAQFVENVITPMVEIYVPAGKADLGKVMLRHVEKMGESMSDYASDQNGQQTGQGGQPLNPNQPAVSGQANTTPTNGNLLQSSVGVQNGPNQSGPLQSKVTKKKFGSPKAKGLPVNK